MPANSNPMLVPEIGPDGLPRDSPVIAYTEKLIEEEKLLLRKYIEENYSKIRDVEQELANLSLELKLTSGSKNAACEHLRKKIEAQNERIKAAKVKEEQVRKVWEAASKTVKDEEAVKQKLCEDLNQLVQESSSLQYARLEELKRRLECLNPGRAVASFPPAISNDGADTSAPSVSSTTEVVQNQGNDLTSSSANNISQKALDGEGRGKKKNLLHGRGKGIGALPKGRGPSAPGWTGAGFDVDGRS